MTFVSFCGDLQNPFAALCASVSTKFITMAGVNDHPESKKSQLDRFSDERAARTAVIWNIPPQITKDHVHIHFQKSKNGGGEVDDIFITKDGKAVVVFEKPEVAKRVMKRPHVLNGKELDLRPYVFDEEETTKVFSHVTAVVNFDMMSPQASQNLLERAKNKAGISWQEKDGDGFRLSGTLDQLENAHKYFQQYFVQRPYLQSTEERIVGDKVAAKPKKNAPRNVMQISKDTASTDIQTFDVEPHFMKLLKRSYRKELLDIEKEFSLEIVWVQDVPFVKIHPRQEIQASKYQKGCEAFISLYQRVHQYMKKEVVDVENVDNDEEIQNAISLVEEENPVVILNLKGHLTVYGEEKYIKSSVQALKKKLGLSQSSVENSRRGQRNISLKAGDLTEKHQRGEPSLPGVLQQTLGNRVKLSLYQGDITDEKVDAIVNPTNAWLQHGKEGVAGAIIRKGGRHIIDCSLYFMAQRRNVPLQVGDAVCTQSGDLACQFVIHAVGPDWSAFGNNEGIAVTLLRRACLESLRLAVRFRLCSVALPAISSGNLGMPKDICARAIFQAVEEFSSSIDAECSNLRDVRVVIIDKATIEVFRKEFVHRYFSEETSQKQMPTQRRPSVEEGGSALATHSSTDPRIVENPLSVPNNQRNNTGNESSGGEKHKSTQDDFTESVRGLRRDVSPGQIDIKEQLPKHPKENNTTAEKTTLTTSVEAQNDERSKDDAHKEKGRDPDKRSRKTTKNSDATAPVARGNLAPNFSQKGNGNFTKSVLAGRGMSSKPTGPVKHPPGLPATNDGLNLANQLMETESNEQFANASDLKNVNQAEADYKRDTDQDDQAIESKPRVKSNKGDKPDCPNSGQSDSPANDPEHPNSRASKTEEKTEKESQMPPEITPTNELAAESVRQSIATELPSSVTGSSQVSQQGIKKEKEPVAFTSETSTTERNTDPSQRRQQTAPSSDHFVQPRCSVCRDIYRGPVEVIKCGHIFCKSCVDNIAHGVTFSRCSQQWCAYERPQPIGTMSWRTEEQSLLGYDDCSTIAVTYNFFAGSQGWEHPRPGHPYSEKFFTAYLPNNNEGQAVCQLLKRAFDTRLLFKIGKNIATGEENQIVWNDIEHKTNRSGGPSNYGYPDHNYLDRVRKQLAKIGIVDDAISQV